MERDQQKILDAAIKEHRTSMLDECEELTQKIDDFDQEFSEWNAYSQKEFSNPQVMVARLMEKVNNNQDKVFDQLFDVNESFVKVASTNMREFQTSDEIAQEEAESILQPSRPTTSGGSPSASRLGTPMLPLSNYVPPEPTVEDLLSNATLTEALSVELSRKIGAASSKLSSIFQQGKREYTAVVTSLMGDELGEGSMDGDMKKSNKNDGADVTANLIPMLQQKVQMLRKELEDANMKSRSVTIQWVSDKTRYEEILTNKHKELEAMLKRLQLSETRLRVREQMARDGALR